MSCAVVCLMESSTVSPRAASGWATYRRGRMAVVRPPGLSCHGAGILVHTSPGVSDVTRAIVSDGLKVAALGVLIAALVVIFVATNRHSSVRPAAAADKSHLVLVKSDSFCVALPGLAKVKVYLAVRNTGTATGTADALPRRMFSDGGVDESLGDDLYGKVGPGQTRRVVAFYGYDPAEHALTRCGVYFDGASRLTRLRVLG